MNLITELKEIANNYTVLYVEDDNSIAQTLIKYLSKLFKEVTYAQNGEEGLTLFTQKKYDVIITDIMMPKVNGLEMSKKIKKLNSSQNIIVVSAYAEIDNFIESIKIGIDGYIIKPIDYEDMNYTLFKTISKIKAFKDKKEYEDKLQQFTEVIEKVAIVSRTDLEGNITYVNDLFEEVSGYSKEELIGNTHKIIRHPDMSKSIYKELWEEIQNGKTWDGTIKNKAKDNTAYYVHALIIPLMNSENEIKEYMGINFLTTDEEMEKREFKKKVLTNYMEFKKTNINSIEMISSLSKELEQTKQAYESTKNQFEKINKKYLSASQQINFYEKTQKEKSLNYQKFLDTQKTNIQKLSESYKKSLLTIEKQKNQLDDLKEEYDAKVKEIIKLNNEVNEQTKIILDLRDTIKNITKNN